MQAKDVILSTIASSDHILGTYLDGLSDADILVMPVEGMNPIAWQIGHLIASERGMLEQVRPGVSPALPVGFDEAHSTDAAKKKEFSGMLPLADYLALAKTQRVASLRSSSHCASRRSSPRACAAASVCAQVRGLTRVQKSDGCQVYRILYIVCAGSIDADHLKQEFNRAC